MVLNFGLPGQYVPPRHRIKRNNGSTEKEREGSLDQVNREDVPADRELKAPHDHSYREDGRARRKRPRHSGTEAHSDTSRRRSGSNTASGDGYGKQDSLESMRAKDRQDEEHQKQDMLKWVCDRLARAEEDIKRLKCDSTIAFGAIFDALKQKQLVHARVEHHFGNGGLDPPWDDPQAPNGAASSEPAATNQGPDYDFVDILIHEKASIGLPVAPPGAEASRPTDQTGSPTLGSVTFEDFDFNGLDIDGHWTTDEITKNIESAPRT